MSNPIRHLTAAGRTLLGLAFVVFGANFFLHFLPMPPHEEPAAAFLGALFAGQVLALIKSVEIVAGLMLLSNRFVPLALALLAPVLVGIVLFHAVYDPAGLALPIVLVALELALAWAYRDAFAPMLRARTEPARGELAPARGAIHAA